MRSYIEFNADLRCTLANILNYNPSLVSLILECGNPRFRNKILPSLLGIIPNDGARNFFISDHTCFFRMTDSRICFTASGLQALSKALGCEYKLGNYQVVIDIETYLKNNLPRSPLVNFLKELNLSQSSESFDGSDSSPRR